MIRHTNVWLGSIYILDLVIFSYILCVLERDTSKIGCK